MKYGKVLQMRNKKTRIFKLKTFTLKQGQIQDPSERPR